MESASNKVKNLNQGKSLVKHWKDKGKRVVFTNGCFDILHLGHADYLEKAREMGDALVVGLNSDSSVSKIKGSNRPLQDQDSRARLLASFQFVDLVILFNEETPLQLITALQPDILVKGSDYLAENIVGADVVKKAGGEVKTINFIPGYSTSRIIEKIKKT